MYNSILIHNFSCETAALSKYLPEGHKQGEVRVGKVKVPDDGVESSELLLGYPFVFIRTIALYSLVPLPGLPDDIDVQHRDLIIPGL